MSERISKTQRQLETIAALQAENERLKHEQRDLQQIEYLYKSQAKQMKRKIKHLELRVETLETTLDCVSLFPKLHLASSEKQEERNEEYQDLAS